MNDFVHQLKEKLNKPLPGEQAHRLMVPKVIENKRFDSNKLANARLSSVLIHFYEKAGVIYFPLIQRPAYGGTHGGQVSFPGGKWEKNDKDLIATAKREAFEEVGISPDEALVIGSLTEIYIPPSNFRVAPIVSYSHQEPDFKLDRREVEALLEVPVSLLVDHNVVRETKVTIQGGWQVTTPYFHIYEKVVWGATAMILSELKALLINS